MLESSDVIAFAGATDLARARAFYEQTLGLTVTEQNDFACVLDAHGTMLRVTAVPKVSPAGYTVLGWRVTDIGAAVRDLAGRGVEFRRYDGMNQDADGSRSCSGQR
jgi:catechol 2,3-dioxygenase-like lactoylglutathione lyase family enzyme